VVEVEAAANMLEADHFGNCRAVVGENIAEVAGGSGVLVRVRSRKRSREQIPSQRVAERGQFLPV